MRRFMFVIYVALIFITLSSSFTIAYEREIKAISSSISENIEKAGKKTIAVVDFTDLQSNTSELGRFLAEELSVDLIEKAKGFKVIDRANLKSILAEHKLSISGLVNPNTIKQLGQIAGVDAIVTGSITPFGDSIRVTCKVIATDTAEVIGASKNDIAKTKAIEELLAKGIEAASSPVLTPMSSQGTAQPSVSPSANKLQSKRVGDIVATLTNISVSKDEIRVVVDFFNQSDEILHVIEDHFGNGHYPSLTDENGYSFAHFGGDKGNRSAFITGVYLQPKSNSTIVLNFKTNNVALQGIGSEFAVTIPFLLTHDRKEQVVSVSFTNIMAQRPR